MGCDGGTIPKRDELVKLKKKPEQKDKEADLAFKWRHCALTQQALEEPVVACGLGKLYSKSAVIEYLLDKTNKLDIMSHIKTLKDIKDLKLSKNPAYMAKAEKTEGALDERGAPYICPVIGLEMSGKFRFVFIWSCGCVMSERAFKQVQTKVKLCHLCMEPFEETDVVVINGTEDDLKVMQTNMETRQAKLKAKKKNKQAKAEVEETATTSSEQITVTKNEETAETSSKNFNVKGKSFEADPKLKNKRLASISAIEDPVYKKAKIDYSIAKDPKATSVYKSIFTSHQSDKDQQRAHWITYNPFYN